MIPDTHEPYLSALSNKIRALYKNHFTFTFTLPNGINFFSSKCLILKSKKVQAMLLGHIVTGSCGKKIFNDYFYAHAVEG